MKNIQIILLVFLLCLVGCNDDFLDTSPKASIAKENFFNSESDLELYINGLHSVSSKWMFLGDRGTDNAATTAALEIKNILIGNPSSENITSGWSWGTLRSINFFLENYTKADAEQSVKDHYAGVAKYFRAQFYFSKVKRYSDVPWYSGALGVEDEDLYKPRDARAVVVDSIMADIKFASEHIVEDVPSGAIHKWAAVMLQARIALYEGTYRKYHSELGLESSADGFLTIAKDAAKELMNSGKYDIYSTGNTSTDYAAMFESEVLFGNSEAILVNEYDVEKEKTSGTGQVFGDYEQSASKSLINSYLMVDGSRFTDKLNYQLDSYVDEFQNRDPRLSQTFAAPGWIRPGNTLPYIQTLNKNFTGYHQHKGNYHSVDSEGIDVAVYRYAETLLVYAEAKAELGTLTQGDLDVSVNKLRSRVGVPALVLATANGDIDAIEASRFPDVSGTNKGVVLEIRRERRVEFAMESFRFDDLMRWHAGKVLETIPNGMYFPGLGKFDMTGDGIDDIILIASSEDIPGTKEQNSLGVKLIYYKVGSFGDELASLYLSNGTSGNMVTSTNPRTFEEPKYYYRPIPVHQMFLNENLVQIFSW